MFNLNEFVYPLFVKEGNGIKEEIPSMPGIYRFSLDELLKEVEEITTLGISSIIIFGITDIKDDYGINAYIDGNIVQKTVLLLKKEFPLLNIITDVCLCGYTTTGHCAILKKGYTDEVNEETIDLELSLSIISKIALSHAEAGVDYVAPSSMLKGQVGRIRSTLNKNKYFKTKILSYSAKFASSFYGPFRDIALSSPKFGDRKGYQLDPRDSNKALERIKEDIKEGSDVVMVKPALSYLDIVKEAKTITKHPLAVYNVSGEYAMVKMGSKNKYWDEKEMVTEIMASFKRAGADIIITYHAKDIARWMKNRIEKVCEIEITK